MSIASKVTFATTVAATVGIIYFVHNNQIEDKKLSRQGIVKDIERVKRKTENLVRLQQQEELTKNFQRIEKRSQSENTTSSE